MLCLDIAETALIMKSSSEDSLQQKHLSAGGLLLFLHVLHMVALTLRSLSTVSPFHQLYVQQCVTSII